MMLFDNRACVLGEGPLWHPGRNTLFWFDILGKKLLARQGDVTSECAVAEHFSAAGWIDEDTLLIASETALWRFDTRSGETTKEIALEAANAATRSNDGRADPWGGFWIGTMGKDAEPGAGAIYRYYGGTLRQLFTDITVSNGICFAPNRSCAYYTDTVTQKIMCQPLAAVSGWPEGPPEVFIDLTGTRLFPDGTVTDAAGNLWVAMWGAACVICFGPDGTEISRIEVPARQTTCPAFGGPDLRDLYVTSASHGLDTGAMAKRPLNGQTFVIKDAGQGLPEPRVNV